MKLTTIFATVVLLLVTTSAFGQKVKVDVDKTVNFTNFKTYGWEVDQSPVIHLLPKSSLKQA